MFLDGIIRCTRYAFGPNRIHLCGPDANKEIFAYMAAKQADKGLENILGKFNTMYPYVKKIAEANKIKDPFDDKVVEAYWLGNELLESVDTKRFYSHLTDGLRINKTLQAEEFRILEGKLNSGARMHHSFHVFNVWKRIGREPDPQILQNMDKCRISWGEITAVDGPAITVKTKPLILDDKEKLKLGPETKIKISRKLYDDYMEEVKTGDVISMHWDTPCEILNKRQERFLEKYTLLSLRLANL